MKRFALTLLVIAIAACTPDKPPEKTVLDRQLEELRKARQVEAQVQTKDQEQRRAVEAPTQDKPQVPGY